LEEIRKKVLNKSNKTGHQPIERNMKVLNLNERLNLTSASLQKLTVMKREQQLDKEL
jgi:hypothetical protein